MCHLPNCSFQLGAEVLFGFNAYGSPLTPLIKGDFLLIRQNGSIIYPQPDKILVKIRLIDD
ncbi:hypothetical protein BJP37_29165 [Moorena bouillonii PNG]|uniref:Uncharacterized protein n=1 Tax=Moorena bouillonii PNG TaxID=568701 RepID=A0A1U7N969_9CYAN|nr:hypothetical protein BJP37_29165 [Moorena bouillonii PNG]